MALLWDGIDPLQGDKQPSKSAEGRPASAKRPPDPLPAAVQRIAQENFASLLGARLVASQPDRVTVELPYSAKLGVGRIHGGAISALVDIAATAAFWACPDLSPSARGATVGFTIIF